MEEPALRRLRRTMMPSADEVEAAVEKIFAGATGGGRGRLMLYALRRFSSLRPAEIARRYSRTPAAVTMATKAIEARARRDTRLASSLRRLQRSVSVETR